MGNNICCIDPPHRKYREMSDMVLEFEKKEVEKKLLNSKIVDLFMNRCCSDV